jgi:DNA-binding GntR family transcriptional regulator
MHPEVLKAVREHDPDAAESAMRKHMQAVLDRLKP